MLTKEENVSLVNLKDGAAIELFDAALLEILENVMDPNTDPKAARSVTLNVTIKPDEDRQIGEVELVAKKTLAGSRKFYTKMAFGRNDRGKIEAREFHSQGTLFDPAGEKGVEPKIQSINGGSKK